MAGLQRSTETFRRSGSSGLVWEDLHLPGGMNEPKQEEEDEAAGPNKAPGMMRRNRSTGGGGGGGRGYRTDQVAPAVDPPSPKVSCCGFCGDFSKNGEVNRKGKARR
ncbi:hypothetical protein HPP92_023166 [Vanilla planifolia]|uniref:MAPK kinase substrate protein n=1 Tax=Vanilla planifolia TaxID=51239 RepID=A0A835PUS1_VANPL|nr:hypothetical protein HPP92_023166 [Vanilla planifolia]